MLVLQIRSNRQSHRLLLSAHPVFGRIQLTQTTFENPAQPSTFIMVLRKYLQGALIESIEQVENDRIVEMTVSNKNEIGDHIQATLIIEIMGKHSNILLVDKSSHKILEVIKHVGFSQKYLPHLAAWVYLYRSANYGISQSFYDQGRETLWNPANTGNDS